MLVKSKNIPLYLCLLLISLRLVGCTTVADTAKIEDRSQAAATLDLEIMATEIASTEDVEIPPEPPTEQPPVAEPKQPVDLWQRLRQGFQMTPEALPTAVIKQQNRYLKNPHNLNKLFERATPYIFHVAQQLDNAELPLELALLPIVESNYDPLAYSHSHAVGLWQFIPSTAKSLGLKRNRWYEGRRDVVESTAAAATYLSYLNKRFKGDWLLALAAYNSGEGAVRKAIRKNRRRGKATDFWSLKLPRETKNYVPQLLALANLVKNPQAHKLQLPAIPNTAFFDIVQLRSQIELSKVIQVTGLTESMFIKLNPAFRRSVTPPEGTYHILLPIAESPALNEFMANNDPSTWAAYREYVVKSGDTLSHIAQRYQLPTALIKNTNGLGSDFLRAGQILRIPPSGEIASATGYKPAQTLSYRVVAGDTLSQIAETFKISTRSIRRSNNLTSDRIKVGQTLVIKAPSSTAKSEKLRRLSYLVRRGDSLHLIAEKFELRVADITYWNKINRKEFLRPGQRLTLYINPLRI
ncbi:MAG: LysM peptidoglycan-binding domain-containing protein [Porticoccaceae bacterium]|nr:LysM peptidoglycan-binding domain-containing protein [Porticoccaceae bacterium]